MGVGLKSPVNTGECVPLLISDSLLFDVLPFIQGLRISESEQASVAPMRDLSSLIIGLTNDLESFNKEFDEHFTSGTLDAIHNAMAVLMANYGYTEDEARDILKSEILSLERQLLTDYEAWKASPSYKSEDMRRFMALCIMATGGGCYAQAIAPKYHGCKLTTTAEDRAQLVGRSKKGWRLHGHAKPGSFEEQKPQETLCRDPGSVASRGPVDILAPFEKAPATDVRPHPTLGLSIQITNSTRYAWLPITTSTHSQERKRLLDFLTACAPGLLCRMTRLLLLNKSQPCSSTVL
jgi:hypothetical protein